MSTTTADVPPVIIELNPVPDVFASLEAVADLASPILFESSQQHPSLGRYSFLTADPFETFHVEHAEHGDDPFSRIRELANTFRTETIPGLPPFQGGFAGLLNYELGHAWEKLPRVEQDKFRYPAMFVGCYDWVLCWDHKRQRAWLISHGFPATDSNERYNRAKHRAEEICRRIENAEAKTAEDNACDILNIGRAEPVVLESNFSRDEYLKAVRDVIEYIRAGDIFQANLTQRFTTPQTCSPLELYGSLRECNPAPFAGFAMFDDWAVVSASPERFMKLGGSHVSTRPIKGTRRRINRPEADLYRGEELRHSEKDRAENVMIVDLLRNDLSRVCTPGSVNVTELCSVENYQTVQHLVSEIVGDLAPDCTVWDLWKAVFPGGSITGAPKIRAMEIITELEKQARGPYCGTMFYAGFNSQDSQGEIQNGACDSNILIRSFLVRNNVVQFSAGGGIVADSDPASEYVESLDKASGMRLALDNLRMRQASSMSVQ